MAEKINWRAQLPPGREIFILDPVLERLQPTLDAMVNEQGLAPEQVIDGLTLRQAKPPERFPVVTSSQMGILGGFAKNVVHDPDGIDTFGPYVEKNGPAIATLLEITNSLGGMGQGEFGDVLDNWGWNTHVPRVVENNLELANDVRSFVPKALKILRER